VRNAPPVQSAGSGDDVLQRSAYDFELLPLVPKSVLASATVGQNGVEAVILLKPANELV
jgi:hypothetical protein